jgi:hypothetical protein
MVYLTEHIKRMKAELAKNNLASLAYYYAREKDGLKTINLNDFIGQELTAAKGYLSVSVTEAEAKQVNKPAYKGVDISSTIYKLLGAYLAVPEALQKKIEQKFNETTFRNQFLISQCVPEYQVKFQRNVNNDTGEESWIFRTISGQTPLSGEESGKIATYLQDVSDVIDLMILEELQLKLIRLDIPANLLMNKSAHEIIIIMLNNFHNATRKMVQPRRKDHPSFAINDEYDVQDVLYVMLKSVFPALKEEDPTPRVGAKSNKIDLILREEGILIEVKMLKQSDSNERDFVEQLKNDIQSYRNSQWLRHLIFFVYDPFSKTKDAHNFYDLNGEQSINGTAFTIEVVLNPK